MIKLQYRIKYIKSIQRSTKVVHWSLQNTNIKDLNKYKIFYVYRSKTILLRC